MLFCSRACFSLILLLGFCVGFLRGQAPPTIEHALKSYGIALDTTSVRNALKDARPTVRGLAAGLLAERKDSASIPAIERLLDIAVDPLERQNLALALVLLKDPKGAAVMHAICADPSLREDNRLVAANQLANIGDYRCESAAASILRSTQDASIRLAAIQMIERDVQLSPDLKPIVEDGLETALRDSVAAVRVEAGKAIAGFHMTGSEAALRSAANLEVDPSVQQQLMKSLAALDSQLTN